jgi:hypothetical protein
LPNTGLLSLAGPIRPIAERTDPLRLRVVLATRSQPVLTGIAIGIQQ